MKTKYSIELKNSNNKEPENRKLTDYEAVGYKILHI